MPGGSAKPVREVWKPGRRVGDWAGRGAGRARRLAESADAFARTRLGLTVRAPGRGGRIFLATAGGAVVLLGLGSVVLGIGGGPAALRPSQPAAATPAVTAAAAPRPPVTELAGTPIAATRTYLLTAYAPGSGRRAQVTAAPGELTVGRHHRHLPRRGDDRLLTSEIVFPLLPAPARCVRRVELRLTPLASQGELGEEGPYPLVAYPSALTGLASGTIPATVPRLDLVTNRPRGDVEWSSHDDPAPAAGGAELTADITDLYQRWAAGMPTPTGVASVPPGTPLVLALRPALTNVLGEWSHTYGGADSLVPPRLVWTRWARCA
ncbi:hypothetical protein I6A84_16100 [Frankia sp. CNm7]|uniref:Uncharacterized protein n=1 Tax=Frankia nepalensis TaxID=1836974 RepID=A0A937R6Y1_9ACTN|nr:hypothetical protein [Frankia nepalensis]MBL7499612.1 hypothetical protein [Frankia nepalensis]MBL7514535.1 hypothetical protein [Frankia nepalensis]MBL7519582.1 hypothetical protein [Frankia nepalensis]MBL7626838.1 hypothetical protein [Frankia nepalensis]